jgi:hypothetical protein
LSSRWQAERGDCGLNKQICIVCNKEILTYNSNPRIAAYEKKWSVHWECVRNTIEDILDRSTPGVEPRK